jgi:hypothetical protein
VVHVVYVTPKNTNGKTHSRAQPVFGFTPAHRLRPSVIAEFVCRILRIPAEPKECSCFASSAGTGAAAVEAAMEAAMEAECAPTTSPAPLPLLAEMTGG